MLFSGFQTLDEHWLFLSREHPGFGTETYAIGSPGSQGFGLSLELHISSPGSPGSQWKTLGLSLHNA